MKKIGNRLAELARGTTTLFLCASLTLSGTPTLAQDGNGGDGYGGGYGGDGESSANLDQRGSFVSNAEMQRMVREFKGAGEYCGPIPMEYRVDCLADQFNQIARSLPKRGDYNRVRKAVQKAANSLRKLANDNRSKSQPAARPSNARPAPALAASRPLVPVERSRSRAVARQAVAIVAEAETVLLRSAEQSERRKLAFTNIAAAIGSNKVLLRSA